MTTQNSDKHNPFIQRWAQIKWVGVALLVFGVVGLLGTAQQSENGPLGDYGDAPDALRAAYDHVDPKIIGAFPATYNAPFDPSFILHRFPKDRVFLGQDVTQENNALEVDRDLDDGWIPGSFLTCSVVELQVFVTIPANATAGPLYLNSLFDWNHDGRWADFSNCDSKRGEITTAEWAIQNLRLDQEPYNLKPGFSGTITLPKILTGPLSGEMWIRFTVTTEKVDEDFFKPVGLGGRGWNGQGDFIYGETEDWFTCLITSRESIFAGCPAPLSNQPPLDPPPGQTGDNNTPNAVNDTATTPAGSPITISVLANDTDPNNDKLTVTQVTQPSNGTVTINANGTVTYTPNVGFSGTDTFTYKICDPGNLCDTATVTVQVTSPNLPPVANNDTAATASSTPVVIAVTSNDSDPEHEALSVIALTQPTHGNATINPDGTITYTSNPGFTGTDSFTYTVCDPHGLCSTATVTVTVRAAPVTNRPPDAINDTMSTNEDTPVTIDVKANDSDPDHDVITVISLTQPSHGVATLNGDDTVTYTPSANYNGSDSFTYTISDGHGGSDTATVTITISPVNDAPVANNDSTSTPEDTPVTVSVLSNDTDLDGDALTISGNTNPSHGTVICTSTTCTYTPSANYNGSDSFTYTISDG
ncbi:tandem-95 repeat protein, partial [Candidatus Acetothermia bacterium]|nr:tandem-95 repeat protein [Candidatus Acetothermia bacterium]